MIRPRSRAARLAPFLLLPVLALPLASCAGGSAGETSDDDAAGGRTAEAPAAVEEGQDASGPAPQTGSGQPGDSSTGSSSGSSGDSSSGGSATRAAPMQRDVVSTGRLELVSDDVARDRAAVLRLVQGWGGLVADEESGSDEDGETAYTSMTVRVPSNRFGTAMTELGEVADLVDQSRSSEDVTTQVLDVTARVRAQERSVRRIEQLLAEADDLGDVIAIESDLARRQADLDSLKSQQAYLADQASLSTITVGIDREQPDAVAPDEEEERGFLAGLDAGWGALVAATSVLATALGAVLPFAAVLVLLGLPLTLALRRRARSAAPAEGAA